MAVRSCPAAVNARRCPGAMALFWGGRSIAWDALHNYVHSTSRYLKEISIRPGDRVLLVRENSPAYFIVLLALWRIGAVPCPADAGILSRSPEAVHEAVKPAFVISPRAARSIAVSKGRGVKGPAWADIEQVVAYGYNDSFLGSETAVDPKIDADAPAVIRLVFGEDTLKAETVTHQELENDPQELAGFLRSLAAGQAYTL